MRAYRRDSLRDEREALRDDLRRQIVELLVNWAAMLTADQGARRYALHSLAEAIASFPSTRLLEPLRCLLLEDLKRWRAEKEEFNAARRRGEPPDPASGARMSYAFRYGQNMLSLATGRNADFVGGDSVGGEEPLPVSHEMTDAVIDVLSGLLLDYEFGAEAARVIAALRPDPVLEIGNPRQFLRYDPRAVRERRAARAAQAPEPADEIAQKLLDGISRLRADGSPDAINLAIELAQAAVRMSCGDHLNELNELVIECGSIEAISRHMMQRLVLGHEVDADVAQRCLDRLDERRSERTWEYRQGWHKWEDLLVIMVFGGKPLEAAQRLLSYDPNTDHHEEQRILEAFGFCGHEGALEALAVLRERSRQQHRFYDWCASVQAIGGTDAGQLLLTALIESPDQDDWHIGRSISRMVAELAQEGGSRSFALA